jgi:hypothetical protein
MRLLYRPSSLVLLLGLTVLAALLSCGGGDVCPSSIDAYCSEIGGCPETWTAAHDAGSWKGLCAAGVILSQCANVDTATLPNFDVGIVFDYDVDSGALFRVESVGQRDVCYAGTGSLETCDDPDAATIPCEP